MQIKEIARISYRSQQEKNCMVQVFLYIIVSHSNFHCNAYDEKYPSYTKHILSLE